MNTKKQASKMPRRPYGSKLSDSNPSKDRLPSTLPIIGLGCSSFSTFFETEENHEDANNSNDPNNNNNSSSTSKDLSWVTFTHPKVQEWIDTIIYAVKECGINLLDTAPWYGHGSSEIVIGYAMEQLLHHDYDDDHPSKDKDNGGDDTDTPMKRQDIIINTKVGRYEANPSQMFDFSAKRVHTSVLTSLERMKCQYIDVLQLHDPEFSPSIDLLLSDTIPELIRMQTLGLVKAIGITGYPLKIQYEIIDRCWNEYKYKFDQSLTYGHCNLHDVSLFATSPSSSLSIATSFADYIQYTHQMGCMCAAPLSMGLLTHQGPPSWHPASSSLKQACATAAQLCETNQVNISKLAICFALAHRRIACTLLGMRSPHEIQQAMEVARLFANENENETSMDIDMEEQDPMSYLKHILTSNEFQILQQLQDSVKGPFAKVWKSGEFEWDGIKDANEFWEQVPGGKNEAERIMRQV